MQLCAKSLEKQQTTHKSNIIVKANDTIKKTKLLFISLLTCSFLMAQENPFKEFVCIDFPARMVKVPKQEIKTIFNDWKDEYLPIDTIHQYYHIDSSILTLHGECWNAPANYLENLEKGFNALSKLDGTHCDCSTQIKKVSNYDVLIFHIESQKWGDYFFFSVNERNNAVLNGNLVYFKSSNKNYQD